MYAILYANESIGISFTMNFAFECAILHDWNAHVSFLVKDRNVMCRIRSLTLSVYVWFSDFTTALVAMFFVEKLLGQENLRR